MSPPFVSVSEADSHLAVGSLKAKITLVVVPGPSPGLTVCCDQFSGIVVPENQGQFSTLVIDDVEDDMTVVVDATVGLAVGRSQTTGVATLEPAGTSVSRGDTANYTTNSEGSSESERFEVEHG